MRLWKLAESAFAISNSPSPIPDKTRHDKRRSLKEKKKGPLTDSFRRRPQRETLKSKNTHTAATEKKKGIKRKRERRQKKGGERRKGRRRRRRKMSPKGASTQLNPIRLQSVSRLRIRRPDKQLVDPCLGVMSQMLCMSMISILSLFPQKQNTLQKTPPFEAGKRLQLFRGLSRPEAPYTTPKNKTHTLSTHSRTKELTRTRKNNL